MTAVAESAGQVRVRRDGASQLLRTFGAMLLRDMRVQQRQAISFIAQTVMQPLLFIFTFAYILPKVGGGLLSGGGGAAFATILVPGMVATSMVTSGMMSVTFPLIMELSWTKEITDRLLAPLPVWALAMQKITSGAIRALLAGLVVFPIVALVHAGGQAPHIEVSNWPVLIVVLLLSSVLAPAIGLFLGTVIEPQKINMLFGFILLPASMLGCVYYPWAALHSMKWLQIIVLANPIVYVSEGLRDTLTPTMPHMSVWAFVPVLALGTFGFCWLAVRSFTHRVLD